MGMPIITPGDKTADQAITDLLESVAMQESSRQMAHPPINY